MEGKDDPRIAGDPGGTREVEAVGVTRKLRRKRVACDACRKSHAKCDGISPCARCLRNALPCTGIPSVAEMERPYISSIDRVLAAMDAALGRGDYQAEVLDRASFACAAIAPPENLPNAFKPLPPLTPGPQLRISGPVSLATLVQEAKRSAGHPSRVLPLDEAGKVFIDRYTCDIVVDKSGNAFSMRPEWGVQLGRKRSVYWYLTGADILKYRHFLSILNLPPERRGGPVPSGYLVSELHGMESLKLSYTHVKFDEKGMLVELHYWLLVDRESEAMKGMIPLFYSGGHSWPLSLLGVGAGIYAPPVGDSTSKIDLSHILGLK